MFLFVERSMLKQLGYSIKMFLLNLCWEVFWARPTEWRSHSRPRTWIRNYISQLAKEHLRMKALLGSEMSGIP